MIDCRQHGAASLDVVVVGAGPAGLSAALVLGRCRRRVLVCDAGRPRNIASHGLHGFLTRDGIEPLELTRIGREQLGKYETVMYQEIEVLDAVREANGFAVTIQNGMTVVCRKLLLATGVVDRLPQIEGFEPLYGRSAFHCPYCDGWEVRDQPIVAYGPGRHGFGLALELKAWSDDVVLCTDGPSQLSAEDRARLSRLRIPLREERLARLEGSDGVLERLVFEDGSLLKRRALFFSVGERQASGLPQKLGCEFTQKGAVATGTYETTNIPGLYVAGDASRAVQLAIVAAAEGAEAAFAINTALIKEDLAAGRSRLCGDGRRRPRYRRCDRVGFGSPARALDVWAANARRAGHRARCRSASSDDTPSSAHFLVGGSMVAAAFQLRADHERE